MLVSVFSALDVILYMQALYSYVCLGNFVYNDLFHFKTTFVQTLSHVLESLKLSPKVLTQTDNVKVSIHFVHTKEDVSVNQTKVYEAVVCSL